MANRFAPTFVIQIDGKQLSHDITQQITRFSYEDCEDQDDLLELALEGDVDLTDISLLQEGNIIKARWGYVDGWSDIKECIIKELEYDFSETVQVRLKAYDVGSKMKGRGSQKIWKNKTYSQIAKEIANKYRLTKKIIETSVLIECEPQGNKSDFAFLRYLAEKIDYQFYIQNNELHFHERDLAQKPLLTLTYKGKDGLLVSFRPKSQAQSNKAEGTEVAAIGFDPLNKKDIIHKANDSNTEQVVLGEKTLFVDGATGEERYEARETGKVIPSPHQTISENKKIAEKIKKEAQLNQLEAEATVIGIPNITAKGTIEIAGVGIKFGGNYFIKRVRHDIGTGGYLMTLDLQRNAIGKTVEKAEDVQGKKNVLHGEVEIKERYLNVNPETGVEI